MTSGEGAHGSEENEFTADGATMTTDELLAYARAAVTRIAAEIGASQ